MQNLNGVEVLRIKGASLTVCPRKGLVLGRDDPLGELDLFREKEIFAQRHLILMLSSEATSGDEVRRSNRKGRHPCGGIWVILTSDTEVLQQSGSDRSSFVRNLLVQEGGTAVVIVGEEGKKRRVTGELLRKPETGVLNGCDRGRVNIEKSSETSLETSS